jgi:predicted dehydrogenase
MKELKVGIVGAGGGVGTSRGMSFARVVRELGENARVTAICDVVKEYADRRAIELGAQAFYNYEAMLDSGIDIVVIATPLPLHADQAVAALERDIHVLSEVTACHDLDSAARLAAAAKRSRAVYMLAENYRYFDEVELVRRLAAAGRFGELYYAEGEYLHDCRDLFRNPDGSLTWRGRGWRGTYCTHSLGPLLYILEDRVVRVTAMDTGRPSRLDPEIPFPETTVFLGETAKGALVRIRVDYQSPRPHNMAYYSLQGTAGAYESARGLGDAAKIWLADEHEPSRVSNGAQWHPLWDYAPRYIPERLAVGDEARRGGHGTSEYWLLKDFFAAVRGEKEPPIDVHRALDYTVPGICAVISAERGGQPVEVPTWR